MRRRLENKRARRPSCRLIVFQKVSYCRIVYFREIVYHNINVPDILFFKIFCQHTNALHPGSSGCFNSCGRILEYNAFMRLHTQFFRSFQKHIRKRLMVCYVTFCHYVRGKNPIRRQTLKWLLPCHSLKTSRLSWVYCFPSVQKGIGGVRPWLFLCFL